MDEATGDAPGQSSNSVCDSCRTAGIAGGRGAPTSHKRTALHLLVRRHEDLDDCARCGALNDAERGLAVLVLQRERVVEGFECHAALHDEARVTLVSRRGHVRWVRADDVEAFGGAAVVDGVWSRPADEPGGVAAPDGQTGPAMVWMSGLQDTHCGRARHCRCGAACRTRPVKKLKTRKGRDKTRLVAVT